MILKLYIENKRLSKAEIIPLDVYNYRIKFQSRTPDKPELQRKILNYIKKISRKFNTVIDIENNRGWIYF